MTGGIFGFLGGIGLFLFGMEVMTAALREIAGARLRRLLSRFTETPVRGALTGALATGIVQSSSAVTVMTLGFVGAGIITFVQSLGVLYGANIGTTLTGWIVMLVGVKLKLGVAALPILFVASLVGMLARGQAARYARFAAGLSLLFIGLDVMQASTAGLERHITPETLPGEGWVGRILMVTMGLALTVLLQSSSAGVALALVLLGSGAISFAQAAALVIGMNLGTTITGLLASLGGGRAMRMTATANLLFNIATATVAFPLLDLMGPLMHATALGRDSQTALVLFHTTFNITGTLLFLPLTAQFARLVEHIVPERGTGLLAPLDRQLLSDEGAALDAAAVAAETIRSAVGSALLAAFGPARDLRPLATLQTQAGPALAALQDWLSHLRVAPDHLEATERSAALMHMLDHLNRLVARCAEADRIEVLAADRRLIRPTVAIAAAMARGSDTQRLRRLRAIIGTRMRQQRRGVLLREHAGLIEFSDVFRLTDAMRWLERVADHAERLAHHAAVARPRIHDK